LTSHPGHSLFVPQLPAGFVGYVRARGWRGGASAEAFDSPLTSSSRLTGGRWRF